MHFALIEGGASAYVSDSSEVAFSDFNQREVHASAKLDVSLAKGNIDGGEAELFAYAIARFDPSRKEVRRAEQAVRYLYFTLRQVGSYEGGGYRLFIKGDLLGDISLEPRVVHKTGENFSVSLGALAESEVISRDDRFGAEVIYEAGSYEICRSEIRYVLKINDDNVFYSEARKYSESFLGGIQSWSAAFYRSLHAEGEHGGRETFFFCYFNCFAYQLSVSYMNAVEKSQSYNRVLQSGCLARGVSVNIHSIYLL